MLSDGFYLMIVGMGFVVSFLAILVFILYLMEKIIGPQQSDTQQTVDQPEDQRNLSAVISAAIHQHRLIKK